MKTFKEFLSESLDLVKSIKSADDNGFKEPKSGITGWYDDGQFIINSRNRSIIYAGKDEKMVSGKIQSLIDFIIASPKSLNAHLSKTGDPSGRDVIINTGKGRGGYVIDYENSEYTIWPIVVVDGDKVDNTKMSAATPKEILKLIAKDKADRKSIV